MRVVERVLSSVGRNQKLGGVVEVPFYVMDVSLSAIDGVEHAGYAGDGALLFCKVRVCNGEVAPIG